MVDLTNKEDRLIDIYEDINTWAINDIVKRIIKKTNQPTLPLWNRRL